jgi:TrmH family RNA methyltransferase
MISRNNISLVRSLEQKKNRDKLNLFIAEGDKICRDLLASDFEVKTVYYTASWAGENPELLQGKSASTEFIEITEDELNKLSLLTSPNKVLALAYQKKNNFSLKRLQTGPVILLDQLQDPGNMGTIIRTADWFGFSSIVASPGTVDFYNPKVIQSSMGSAFRITHYIADLEILLNENREERHWPVYAAVLQGKNLFKNALKKNGFYLFGNEAKGISNALLAVADCPVTIPHAPVINGKQPADSLNVAIAAAVVMAEYARQDSI